MKLTHTDQLLDQAQQAFKHYRDKSATKNVLFLFESSGEIERITETIVEVIQEESSGPETTTRGNRGRITVQLKSFPASADVWFISIDNDAIDWIVAFDCIQNSPEEFVSHELADNNRLNIFRCVNNEWTRNNVTNTK